MTPEEVIERVLSYNGPSDPGPTNWRKWIGDDAPQRIADALRKAGLLKKGK